MAALLLFLQNIDEYCEQFESKHPLQGGIAEMLKNAAYSTYLPQLFLAEKNMFSDMTHLFSPPKAHREELPLPPQQKTQFIYIRIPALRQLNTLRINPPEKESTLIPAELLTVPAADFLPTDITEQVAKESTQTVPAPPQELPPTPEPPAPEASHPPVNTPEDLCRENEQIPVHCRIMMLGDSLMEDLGPATHRTLRHRKGLHFILTAKYSTGLSRPEYFNWPENMEKAVAGTRPDIIIFFIGANDGMPIKVDGRTVYPNSGDAWKAAYRAKMAELFEIGRRYNCKMIWVGLPPMGSRYAKILAQTEQAQRDGCNEQGIQYIDTIPILGDENGRFRTYMTDGNGKAIRLRARDKEHISPDGNKLVIEQLLPVLERSIADFRKKNPEKILSKQEASRPGRAPLDITIRYAPGK